LTLLLGRKRQLRCQLLEFLRGSFGLCIRRCGGEKRKQTYSQRRNHKNTSCPHRYIDVSEPNPGRFSAWLGAPGGLHDRSSNTDFSQPPFRPSLTCFRARPPGRASLSWCCAEFGHHLGPVRSPGTNAEPLSSNAGTVPKRSKIAPGWSTNQSGCSTLA
jgi:hypothetical protein